MTTMTPTLAEIAPDPRTYEELRAKWRDLSGTVADILCGDGGPATNEREE